MEFQEFPSKTFCLTVPRNFVRTSFIVSLLSGAEKVWIRERGEYQDFPSKTFCLTVPRISVGKHFSVSLPSGAEEVWIREGGGSIKIFRRENFLSLSAEKFSEGTL